MILELDEDIRYSPFAQPVCTARDTSYNPSGLKIHMYTYGHNNTELNDNRGVGILRYGTMQIDKLDARGGPYFSVFDREGRVNMRAGDSGGGAISYEYGSRYVVGVVSHAINGITYFTSVGHHFEQICTHTGVC
ncbi:hypothetical protein CAEBREN_24803 [Caenorhabditis brenneri]|uniref:Peptidase S1 domain-containing protein n=1 Tax=Caenorhabditis brenneri TaxID=135651 RepID=G0P0A2_CAEBE|nr:hypothetical protein CAEBREN_24803 [Caenorhabditis brenneri]